MSATSQYQDWLLQLTALPTASGHEDRIIQWVRDWAGKQPGVEVKADKFGNLLIKRRGARSTRPIYFTAHMDHPAFVVAEVVDRRTLRAGFRGGVDDRYFVGTPVLLFHDNLPAQAGVIVEFASRPFKEGFGASDGIKSLTVQFAADLTALPGDVMTWDTGPQRIEGDRLYTPACDDVAGVAAAVSAFHAVLTAKRPGKGGALPDARVLLTRAEEFGFVGAIAACKGASVPKAARLLALENSKSYPESPIGAGAIVRVGDYTSTFDPDLTYRVGRVAEALARHDPSFKYQRKLMPGGTCEASVYQAYGYTSTCLCLPLGNYHNMNEATGKIEAETISLSDYHALVRLLAEVAHTLDDPARAPALKRRLDELYTKRRWVLDG